MTTRSPRQRWILRRTRAGLGRGWLAATFAGTLLGRSLQFTADTGGAAAVLAAWPTVVQAVFAAVVGALVGAVMAAPQALVLAKSSIQAWQWIGIRAVAWSIALPTLLLAGALTAAAAGSAVGLVVGAFVGLLEGFVLVRLIRFALPWYDDRSIHSRTCRTAASVQKPHGSRGGAIVDFDELRAQRFRAGWRPKSRSKIG